MYTYQQRLEYARKLKRLHDLYVIKDNIHLTYKYKNQNKAIHNAHSIQDKIINSIIDDAVYGNANAIKNIDSTIEKLMTSTLENERKRIHHQNDKYVNRAVELNSERYTKILTNRINTEAIKLERKIESELRSGVHNGLSEAQTRNVLQEKYQDTAKARIRNIIRDGIHTNESNISFINALNEGYNYKIWMNGRSKGKTRPWHKAKLIAPAPIEDYFDIYGPYGHKESMYPGDLYSGAENVANCRCWLRYTNRRPEGLSKTPNTYNIPNTSYLSPQNKPTNNANKENILTKPLETFKTRISNTTEKVTSKIKQITKKITSKIKTPINKSKKYNLKNNSKSNKSVIIDDKVYAKPTVRINERVLKKKLKKELPNDISDEAINYIIDIFKKRAVSKFEYGQIFDYTTGKPSSIEFGDNSEKTVNITERGPYKNLNKMSYKELEEYFANKDKLQVNYIQGDTLATQHNHTNKGLCPPSTSDFLLLMSQEWANYSFCISRNEIWVIEFKSKFNLTDYRVIERDIGNIQKEAENMKGKKSKSYINQWYGNELQKYINNKTNIKLFKVRI